MPRPRTWRKGRRSRLKICSSSEGAGSSPAVRTKFRKGAPRLVKHFRLCQDRAKSGRAKKMYSLGRRVRRRRLLQAGVAAAGSLLLPGRAPAQGGAKPLSGTTLNIACWSSPYAKLLTEYVPQF